MAKVGIVMGSDSDMPIMAKAADVLAELGVDFEPGRLPIFRVCVPLFSPCRLLASP